SNSSLLHYHNPFLLFTLTLSQPHPFFITNPPPIHHSATTTTHSYSSL
ncbi:hypothetical protein LINPERHAP1_LOCUS24397, partial [Linum perenne]